MKTITSLFLSFLFVFPTMAKLSPRQLIVKKKIIKIAKENTNSVINRVEIRSELDQLVQELTQNLPLVDTDTWVQYATGSWKQLWADEQNNGPSSIGQNFDRIYQYVSSKGQAVNLGERILSGNRRVTFALRAKGSVNENIQNTQIKEGFFKETPLLSGMSIKYLAEDILNKRYQIFTPTILGEFPQGPINAQSDLTFSYLDQDLKIGTAPNVYTGFNEMFILIREEIIK